MAKKQNGNKIFWFCKLLLRNCKVEAVDFLSSLCYNEFTKSRRYYYEIIRQAN